MGEISGAQGRQRGGACPADVTTTRDVRLRAPHETRSSGGKPGTAPGIVRDRLGTVLALPEGKFHQRGFAMKFRALAIIAALAAPTLAVADDKTPPADKATDKTIDKADKADKFSADEVRILAHLHHVNQMEIDVGKAAQKSGTARVKSYSDTLEKDHKSADADLTAFAKKRGLRTIPADKPDSDAEKQEQKDMTTQVAHLKTLKGAEFDKEFLTMMVTGHDKEVARIDTAINTTGSDQDFQTFLKSVKPVLQRHADEARDLQKSPQASAD
jgi:predicted outer membrane protein